MAKSNVTVLGTKELNDMFMQLPKQIKKNTKTFRRIQN